MSLKSILVKMFGEPLWPFAKKGLADTNPCLDAVMIWQQEQAAKGKLVGMVWYCIGGRLDLYHCVGYEWRDLERHYYDPQHGRDIELEQNELIGANHIPYNYVEGAE